MVTFVSGINRDLSDPEYITRPPSAGTQSDPEYITRPPSADTQSDPEYNTRTPSADTQSHHSHLAS